MTAKLFAILCILAIAFGLNQKAEAQVCNRNFRTLFGLRADAHSGWRTGVTNRTGDVFATSSASERVLKDYRDNVTNAVYIDSSTLPMEIELQNDALLTVLRPAADYGTGKFPKYAVEGIKDGKVGVIMGLPVSGHTGGDNARLWAKTDLYNIRIEKEVNGQYVTDQLIEKQQSREATTFHELTLKMEKGVNYKLSYWRDGSAGPFGYPEGRFIELIWNGN